MTRFTGRVAVVSGASSGIGLAVARTIVERHGGTIVARSEGAGMGSDFTVIVAAAQGARSATEAETS